MWKPLCALLLTTSCTQTVSGGLYLVETAPLETTIGSSDLPEFHETWRALIDGAQNSLDLAHFYASNEPGSRLEPIVVALEGAAARGVTVRFLVDERFYGTYPETLDRLVAGGGVTVRRLSLKPLTGGVLHAKYMIADGNAVCIGSANFDWRALEHIQELGAVVESEAIARAVRDVFNLDWWIAGGSPAGSRPVRSVEPDGFPQTLPMANADAVRVTPVFSPKELLPSEELWDLPYLLAWIEQAQEKVWVQVMTFRMTGRDGERFDELDSALRHAAARGVDVRLLVADWGKRPGTIEGLKELSQVNGIEIKMVTLPPAAQGHIPFARVIHSKYMLADRARAWVGSSNWEKGYFYESRNVGLLIEGEACAGRLSQYFEEGWSGPYSYFLDPNVEYEIPRVGE